MVYVYEIDIQNLDFDLIKKLLEKLNIKYHREKNKLKIFLEDFYNAYRFDKVIKAVKANFSLDICEKIYLEEFDIIDIDLKKISNKKTNHLIRIKGRIIGENGKALKEIEIRTGAKISLIDKYLYIAGDEISLQAAYETLGRLISGSSHSKVFEFADKIRKHLKNKEKEASFYI
ncbi:MAG: KH domain-containing protein [Candidatus Aenigmatarchaeota archaeon]